MVTRSYQSDRRNADAAATRAKIRAAATRLFVDQGYALTTLREVAKEAGVGERTLYAAFASKFDLFHHALNVATAGDEEPVAVRDRAELRNPLEDPDSHRALAGVVDYGVDLLERAGDLIWIGIEAAGADERIRELSDAGRAETRAVMRRFAQRLDEQRALRRGLSADKAADLLQVLISPHTRRLLRGDLGWSLEDYRSWVHDAAAQQILPSFT